MNCGLGEPGEEAYPFAARLKAPVIEVVPVPQFVPVPYTNLNVPATEAEIAHPVTTIFFPALKATSCAVVAPTAEIATELSAIATEC